MPLEGGGFKFNHRPIPHARSMGCAAENLPKFLGTRETQVQCMVLPKNNRRAFAARTNLTGIRG
jgi:hypothetical protein